MIAVTLDVGDRRVPAELDESPTALDLLELLPLSAAFTDFADQEKLALLPRRLTTQDAPKVSEAGRGDIGYYAPSQHLVLYYADVARFPGIIPIGRFAPDAVGLLTSLPSGNVITVARPPAVRS